MSSTIVLSIPVGGLTNEVINFSNISNKCKTRHPHATPQANYRDANVSIALL